MSISEERKQALIKEYATTDGDTGSPEVQVAILTERITNLTEHFKTHAKDNHSAGPFENGFPTSAVAGLCQITRCRPLPILIEGLDCVVDASGRASVRPAYQGKSRAHGHGVRVAC
ncbi:MAG: hypothetical protein CM15mP21_5590 [Hyphomicrobiales bacterium]|nr:MAG: hypothetical protein CM15mP21_5590 [Hyphomicrobiales bacterium]